MFANKTENNNLKRRTDEVSHLMVSVPQTFFPPVEDLDKVSHLNTVYQMFLVSLASLLVNTGTDRQEPPCFGSTSSVTLSLQFC